MPAATPKEVGSQGFFEMVAGKLKENIVTMIVGVVSAILGSLGSWMWFGIVSLSTAVSTNPGYEKRFSEIDERVESIEKKANIFTVRENPGHSPSMIVDGELVVRDDGSNKTAVHIWGDDKAAYIEATRRNADNGENVPSNLRVRQ